ncbi:MAG: hypothetical protein H7248_10415 [Microbacteriaceae bacterium]|nr:hypothetical protein [Microbacteriaceae bacterium]
MIEADTVVDPLRAVIVRPPAVLLKVTVLPLTVSDAFELVNTLEDVWSPKSAPVPDTPRVVNACTCPVDTVADDGEIVITGGIWTVTVVVAVIEPFVAVIVREPVVLLKVIVLPLTLSDPFELVNTLCAV